MGSALGPGGEEGTVKPGGSEAVPRKAAAAAGAARAIPPLPRRSRALEFLQQRSPLPRVFYNETEETPRGYKMLPHRINREQ